MSFDPTNPGHFQYFKERLLEAFTTSWLGNAYVSKQSKEGRPINRTEELKIRADAETTLQEWMSQIWQDGHDTALINGQSQNPHDKDAK